MGKKLDRFTLILLDRALHFGTDARELSQDIAAAKRVKTMLILILPTGVCP